MRIIISIITITCIFFFVSVSSAFERKYLSAAGLQEIRQEAPELTVINAAGGKVGLKDLRGKIVILHLWATWCKPCKEEFPLFEKLYRRYKDDIALLPIAIDAKGTQEEIDAFAKELGVSFPVYLARKGEVTERYWTWGVPETYFIDKKGWIVARAIGPRDWASDSIRGFLDALLNEK
jgi:thiol-disulfide isomerase/thioredoxin